MSLNDMNAQIALRKIERDLKSVLEPYHYDVVSPTSAVLIQNTVENYLQSLNTRAGFEITPCKVDTSTGELSFNIRFQPIMPASYITISPSGPRYYDHETFI